MYLGLKYIYFSPRSGVSVPFSVPVPCPLPAGRQSCQELRCRGALGISEDNNQWSGKHGLNAPATLSNRASARRIVHSDLRDAK